MSLTAGSRSILGDRNVSRHQSLADNEIISFYSVFAGIHKHSQIISRSVFTSTAFTQQLDCGAHFANSAELKSSPSNKIIELISAMCIVSMFHLKSNLEVETRWNVPKLPVNVFPSRLLTQLHIHNTCCPTGDLTIVPQLDYCNRAHLQTGASGSHGCDRPHVEDVLNICNCPAQQPSNPIFATVTATHPASSPNICTSSPHVSESTATELLPIFQTADKQPVSPNIQ